VPVCAAAASIDRVVAAIVLPASHVVDREDNGALVELTIDRCLPEQPVASDDER
jgi:hypothetical protein